MTTTRKLRLGPLPKTESVKVTFACPIALKAELDRYAAMHGQTYGEAVDAATLVPHMLEAFMAGDRAFRRGKVKDRRSAALKSAQRSLGGDLVVPAMSAVV